MKRLFVTGLLFMFMAVAPVVSLFAAEPVGATNSGPISSVTVAGLVAQNGTPTPTTPIDIVSNNGVIKYGKPITLDATRYYAYLDTSLYWSYASDSYSIIVPVEVGKQYRLTADATTPIDGLPNTILRWGFIDELPPDSWKVVSSPAPTPSTITAYDKVRTTPQETPSIIVTATHPYMIVQMGAKVFASNIANGRISVTEQSLYTDGEVETIADSANHTATVATLLGVGDYRDTQNINTGAITRKVGVLVLDGVTDGKKLSAVWNTTYKRGNITVPTIKRTSHLIADCACTHFPYSADTQGEPTSPGFSSRSQDNLVLFSFAGMSNINSSSDANAYLAEQYAAGTPVIVVYPLATETTESVAGQTMTTAPVNNRTGGVTGMTITTLLSSGASVVTTIAANAIKIATTAYNSARFSPVVTDLNSAVATIREIVTKTINQTAAIASLQADKQTRPEDACPAGKKCLLVETEENGVIVPHWFPIIEAPENTE